MRLRGLLATCLAAALCLTIAGCGPGSPQASAHPTVRIISPRTDATISTPPYLPGTVTVKVAVSHFKLTAGPSQPGSGRVRLYADGQIETDLASTTAIVFLSVGTYTLKAALVTGGEVVAWSAPLVVTIGVASSSLPVQPSSAPSCPQASQSSGATGTGTQGAGPIALFSDGLPPCAQVNNLVAGPAGDLWFTYTICNGSCAGGGVGRVTPTATIFTYATKGAPSYAFTQGSGGTLWFTYQGGIGRISASGAASFFAEGLPAGSFLGNLHLGPGGDLWFTDCIGTGQGCPSSATGAIGRITPSGQIAMFSQGLPGPVSNMVLGSDGNMWFEQQGQVPGGGGATVGFGRITPSGQITMFSQGLPAGVQAANLEAGPGGALWFDALATNGQDSVGIGRITMSGQITVFSQGLPKNSGIGNLLSGPAGAIWFPTCVQSASNGGCVKGTGAIGRITPTGVITLFNQGLPATGAPSDLILGQGGDMWFEYGQGGFARGCGGPASWSDPIGVITPVGTITTFSQGLPANVGISPLTPGAGGSLWFSECVLDQGSCSGRLSIGSISPAGAISLFTQGLPAEPVTSATGSSFSGPGTSPYSLNFMTEDSAGNLWFTYGNAIGEVTPAGAISVFSQGLSQASYLDSFAIGSDGNLWFVDQQGTNGAVSLIGRLHP